MTFVFTHVEGVRFNGVFRYLRSLIPDVPRGILPFVTLLAAAAPQVKEGQAIAFGLGVGLGAVGAGIGIGSIFASMIQSVARQPELRGELQGIMWLGFALTEAVVFYGLLGGLLAFVLVK